MIKKLTKLKELSCEEARLIVDYFSDEMLSLDKQEKKAIKKQFIKTLTNPENYQNFSYGEIVTFFLYEADEFNNSEKEEILKYACENIYCLCDSRNEMVPTIILDFIVRHISKKLREQYCGEKMRQENSQKIDKCLKIILEI